MEGKLASILGHALQSPTIITQRPSPALPGLPEPTMPRQPDRVCGKSGRKFLFFLIGAGKAEVALTIIWTRPCTPTPLPSGKINYERKPRQECPRTLGMAETAERQTPGTFFF